MSKNQTNPHPYVPSGFFMRHVVNPITLRLGGPTLTVVGRRSGRPISTPVPPFEYEATRYPVSGGGETDWVRNLRAGGHGELRKGRSREPFRAVEVEGDEHDRVVTAYREHMGCEHEASSRRFPIRPISPSLSQASGRTGPTRRSPRWRRGSL